MIGSIGRSHFWRISPGIRELGTISSQAKESDLVLRELGKWEYPCWERGLLFAVNVNDKEYHYKQHSTIYDQIADDSYDEEVKLSLLSLNL
jgi:hypothetical protein